MQIYREFEIQPAIKMNLAELGDALDSIRMAGWARDLDRERSLRSVGVQALSFRYQPLFRNTPVWLFLGQRDDVFQMTNVVPTHGAGSLSLKEVNLVVENFKERLEAALASRGLNWRLHLGPDMVGLEQICNDPEVRTQLLAYSNMANRSIPHPMDDEQWRKFVILAHQKNLAMTSSELKQWLVEDEGWEWDRASELAIAYESERDLLKQYDVAGTR